MLSELDQTVFAKVTAAIADAIQELGRVPSGHLYAYLMSRLTLDQFNASISSLKELGWIKEVNYELIWIGKEID